MRVIAVIGATGFIGNHLLKYIAANHNGAELRVLVRKNYPKVFGSNVTFVEGDILTSEGLDQLLVPGAIVFNLAFLTDQLADNVLAAKNIIQSCSKNKVKRLIHCSTAVVAGASAEDIITENTPCQPVTVYEKTKIEVENALITLSSNEVEVVVLRPTAVFGPGGKNLLKLANTISKGFKFSNYLRSKILAYRSMNLVAVENVVTALIFLALREENLNREVFIVSDDDDLKNNYLDVENLLSTELLGPHHVNHNRKFTLTPWMLKGLFAILGRSAVNPIVKYDASKLVKFGYKKATTLDSSLKAFAEWYKAQKAI